MTGRKPLPANVHKLRGTRSRAAASGDPVKPSGGTTCPAWLDSRARQEWRRIAPELRRVGLLTRVDRSTLGAYCSAVSRWAQAEDQIAREGATFRTPNGYCQKHPAVTIAKESMELIRRLAAEFGLSPSARQRIHASPEGKEKKGAGRYF